MEDHEIDQEWRSKMLAAANGSDLSSATGALISLSYHEVDRVWMEGVLLEIIDGDADLQLRQLAVICLGHVARIHRSISPKTVIPKLRSLTGDPNFGSRAANALDDIEMFVSQTRTTDLGRRQKDVRPLQDDSDDA